MCILRPFQRHQGSYIRLQHGYRQRNGITRASWKQKTVQASINYITDAVQEQRCSQTLSFFDAKRQEFL